MIPTRRGFLKTTGAVGAGLMLGRVAACTSEPRDSEPSDSEPSDEVGGASLPPRSRRLLILGGTGFIGPHMVRYALERGHEVSVFTRGRSETDLPDGVEHLIGDRNDDHTALEGRVGTSSSTTTRRTTAGCRKAPSS